MVQLTEIDRNERSDANEHFPQAAIGLTHFQQQARPTIKRHEATRRSIVPSRNRRYGLPPSDFPPSRLVKYSPKHQYTRLFNFPYPGAHWQPRMNTIVVQVQGISRFNNTSNPESVAAFGVFYGAHCARNCSFPLPSGFKQTAHRAVLEAIRCTINSVIQMRSTEFIPGWKEVIIMTDSDYAKNSMSLWVWQWERRGWSRAGNKGIIENVEIMQDLHNLVTYMEDCLNMSVRFWKVGREDIAGADELAQKAMRGLGGI